MYKILLPVLILIPNNNTYFFYLPVEIRTIIYNNFKKYKDIKTQLNIRSVCKDWYVHFPVINYYKNNHMMSTFIFSSTKFKCVLPHGFIKNQIEFGPYGSTKYVEYNNNKKLIKIILYTINEIIIYEIKNNKIIKQIIDISKNKYYGNNCNNIQYLNKNNNYNNCIEKYNPFIGLNKNHLHHHNMQGCIIA